MNQARIKVLAYPVAARDDVYLGRRVKVRLFVVNLQRMGVSRGSPRLCGDISDVYVTQYNSELMR